MLLSINWSNVFELGIGALIGSLVIVIVTWIKFFKGDDNMFSRHMQIILTNNKNLKEGLKHQVKLQLLEFEQRKTDMMESHSQRIKIDYLLQTLVDLTKKTDSASMELSKIINETKSFIDLIDELKALNNFYYSKLIILIAIFPKEDWAIINKNLDVISKNLESLDIDKSLILKDPQKYHQIFEETSELLGSKLILLHSKINILIKENLV